MPGGAGAVLEKVCDRVQVELDQLHQALRLPDPCTAHGVRQGAPAAESGLLPADDAGATRHHDS